MTLPTSTLITLLVLLLLLLGQIDYFFGNTKIFDLSFVRVKATPSPKRLAGDIKRCEFAYIVSSHINLGKPEEFIAFWARLDDFLECQVHPRIAINEMTIESLSIFELDKHGMALRGRQQAKR